MMLDYEKLFRVYAKQLIAYEGMTYLNNLYNKYAPKDLSEEERAFFKRLDEEV